MTDIRIAVEWGNSWPLRNRKEFYILQGGLPFFLLDIYNFVSFQLYDLELWLRRRRYNRKKKARKKGAS